MLIRKVQHVENSFQKKEEYQNKDRTCRVQRLITTYWFLIIPIYQSKIILSHNNTL